MVVAAVVVVVVQLLIIEHVQRQEKSVLSSQLTLVLQRALLRKNSLVLDTCFRRPPIKEQLCFRTPAIEYIFEEKIARQFKKLATNVLICFLLIGLG